MSEINLKSFDFDEHLLRNVKLFDEVLKELGEPPLLENEKFSILPDLPMHPGFLVLELTAGGENTLPIIIWFEGEDLVIDVGNLRETFEWSAEQIAESEERVVALIRNLLSGYVLIESHGGSEFIQIFDAKGFFVDARSRNNWLHFFTGLYLFRYKNYRRLYLPIFSKSK